ncbi:PhaM family polyhydroxyalkanoate granule multifunctional regulatory protein [Massilia aerilata]|uniref:PhaM family polyhydroxyalkanoate granule multifunctional regulatory protein n=1 Tax=Massilia aerilata TaxID=453817 RepID=A0ABW0S0U8_9BURK
MQKPPAANMPGMTDTLDFVKNLWGSMNLPGTNMSGMAAPPMSVEDLDKRIADLKAVESWLNMNVTMLRGTIQTMEVQRSTMSTLKAMGASMAEAMRQSGVSAEKMAGMPFGALFGQPGAGKEGGGGAAQPGAPAQDQQAAPDPAAAMGMPAALAWWNMLQEQFTQAVATAMTPADGAAKAEAPAPEAPTEPAPQAAPNGNGRARGGKPKADKA